MSKEYSVWLVPEEDSEEMRELDNLISSYAEDYGTPDFMPHVTLVGGVEKNLKMIEEKVDSLTEDVEPIQVSFNSTHFSTTRHQCIYILVEPTEKLLKLREKLREDLEMPENMYVPHLSLVYSDMELSERGNIHSSLDDLPEGFKADRVMIFDTSTQDEEDWECVQEFRL